MTYTYIPYVVEGSIIAVNEKKAADDAGGASALSSAIASATSSSGAGTGPAIPAITYVCQVTMADGHELLLPRVVEASMFGGIDDYVHVRRRASMDATQYSVTTPGDMMKMVGDHVLIAFVGGNIHRPMIIGCAPHPMQVDRFDEGVSQKTKPQMFMRYLGLALGVDDKGQFSLTHFGAPTVKFTGGNGLGGEALDSALGSLASVGGDSYKGYEEGEVTLEEAESDAIKYAGTFKAKTTMEFLDDGKWRVRDSLGQMIELDPKKSQIYIANNGVKSTDPVDAASGLSIETNSTDSEYVLLDRKKEMVLINARKIIQLYSFGVRKDVTDKDHSHKIKGDELIVIGGDKTDEIDGSFVRTVKGDVEDNVNGSVTLTVDGDVEWNVTGAMTFNVTSETALNFKGDWTIDCKGNWTLNAVGDISIFDVAGAGLKASSGKIEVGGKAAGIFDTMSNVLQQLDAFLAAVSALTVPTAVGPSGPPINIAQFIQVQTQMAALKAKIDTVKGSL